MDQVLTAARLATGAAVESTRYDNFSLETLTLSVKGRIIFPTSIELA